MAAAPDEAAADEAAWDDADLAMMRSFDGDEPNILSRFTVRLPGPDADDVATGLQDPSQPSEPSLQAFDPAAAQAKVDSTEADISDTSAAGLQRLWWQRMADDPWRGWRPLPVADAGTIARLQALRTQAPHAEPVLDLVLARARASLVTGQRLRLPPLLLLGEPGVGKSWVSAKIADVLRLPHERVDVSSATAVNPLTGTSPVWRHPQMGLVARALIGHERTVAAAQARQRALAAQGQKGPSDRVDAQNNEDGGERRDADDGAPNAASLVPPRSASPLLLLDEIEKGRSFGSGGTGFDAVAALLTLLEPVTSRSAVDELLELPFDASAVLWVATANSLDGLPAALVDRFEVVTMEAPDAAARHAVLRSVWADVRVEWSPWFDEAVELERDVIRRLADLPPRRVRRALETAAARAAAAGRRQVISEDLTGSAAWLTSTRPRMGFRA